MFKRLPVLPARSDSRRRLVQQASRCSKRLLILPARRGSRRLAQRASRCSKRLLVLPARSDSRRRPAQQASRCSKGCRFCLREEVHGGGRRSRLPVVQKAAGSACMKRFTAAGAAGFPLFKKAVDSARAKRFTAGAGAAGFPLLKRLPVSAARRDSRRRLAQQASHC